MKELIYRWGKHLEGLVAKERGAKRFKDALRPYEYVHVFGDDSSMLELVLDRGCGIYQPNRYTRIVWSERHPAERPFAYYSYISQECSEKPKQEFHNAVRAEADKPEYLTADEVAGRLWDSTPNPLALIPLEN